jgi:hypothetical protein
MREEQGSDSALSNPSKELRKGRIERPGNGVNTRKRKVLFATLDSSDVGSMQTADGRELLL